MQAVPKCPKITVIRPQGCLSAANALELERNLIATLVQQDVSILLVDLAAVEFLDKSGLMALVSAHKLAQSLGRSFKIGSVSSSIRMILELTQLDEVFEISEDNLDLAVA